MASMYGVISGWNPFGVPTTLGEVNWTTWKILYEFHGGFVFQKNKDPLNCLRNEYWKRKQLVLGHVILCDKFISSLNICIYKNIFQENVN